MTHRIEDARAAAMRAIVVEAAGSHSASPVATPRQIIAIVAAAVALTAVTSGAVVAISSQGEPPRPPIEVEPSRGPDFEPVVAIGDPVTFEGFEEATFDLGEPPAGAEFLTLAVTCLTEGNYKYYIEPYFDMPFYCHPDELGSVSEHEIEIGGMNKGPDILFVDGSRDTSYSITATWGAGGDVIWQTNDSGQTYGTAGSGPEDYPDLLRAVGETKEGISVIGYIYSTEMYEPVPDENGEMSTIPLYLSDGKTVIGTWPAGG